MKFKVITLGCKMNKYESDAITSKLIDNGYTLSDDDVADIYIINTCA